MNPCPKHEIVYFTCWFCKAKYCEECEPKHKERCDRIGLFALSQK
jgi:hypothetical protein